MVGELIVQLNEPLFAVESGSMPSERVPKTAEDKELTVQLVPDDVETAGLVKSTVVKNNGKTSSAATLHVLVKDKVGAADEKTLTLDGRSHGVPDRDFKTLSAEETQPRL